MHRGKNRSRKPVEVATATPTPPIKTLTSDTNNSLHYSAYHHPQSHFLNLNNASNLLLDSAGSCSQTNTDYRFLLHFFYIYIFVTVADLEFDKKKKNIGTGMFMGLKRRRVMSMSMLFSQSHQET